MGLVRRADAPLKYKVRDTMSERDRRSHARYHNRNEVEGPVLVSSANDVRGIIARVRAGATFIFRPGDRND